MNTGALWAASRDTKADWVGLTGATGAVYYIRRLALRAVLAELRGEPWAATLDTTGIAALVVTYAGGQLRLRLSTIRDGSAPYATLRGKGTRDGSRFTRAKTKSAHTIQIQGTT